MSQWFNGFRLLKNGTLVFAKAWAKLGKLSAAEEAALIERFRDLPGNAKVVLQNAIKVRNANAVLPEADQVILKGKVGLDEILHARAAANINAQKVLNAERKGLDAASKAISSDPVGDLERLQESRYNILRGPTTDAPVRPPRARKINISQQLTEDSQAERRLRIAGDATENQFNRDFEQLKLQEGVRTPLSIDVNAIHDKPFTETNRFQRMSGDIRARTKLQQLREAERRSLEESAQALREESARRLTVERQGDYEMRRGTVRGQAKLDQERARQRAIDEESARAVREDAQARMGGIRDEQRAANQRAHAEWRDANFPQQPEWVYADAPGPRMRPRGAFGRLFDKAARNPMETTLLLGGAAAIAPSIMRGAHDPETQTGVVDQLMGWSEQKAVADAFRDRDEIITARMKVERLQQGMAVNAARLASIRPDLYNQILYKRQLPRGAVPIGGQPDNAFLNQITLAMASGSLEPEPTAEQQYLMR